MAEYHVFISESPFISSEQKVECWDIREIHSVVYDQPRGEIKSAYPRSCRGVAEAIVNHHKSAGGGELTLYSIERPSLKVDIDSPRKGSSNWTSLKRPLTTEEMKQLGEEILKVLRGE